MPLPHMEDRDQDRERTLATDRLRLAAVTAEHQPLKHRVEEASSLLMRLRGILAERRQPIPADLDQQLFAWLHAGAGERKAEEK